MRRRYSFIWAICLLFFLFCVSFAYSQVFCAFDNIKENIKSNYPSIAENIADNEVKLKQIITNQKKLQPFDKRTMLVYNIPIVVHVLHTGDDIGTIYNPDTTQIKEAIDYLNDIYSGNHSSLTPLGTDAAGDIGIRFVLAQRDPDCNPTNGIHRVDMSADANYIVNGASFDDLNADIAMKTPIIWDKSRYYNIYVVNKISGSGPTSVAGYAYLPTNSVVDGTVILASEMKAGSRTLVHEIGHAFNLYHPFEGSRKSTDCPAGGNDMVDDTDPVSYNISADGIVNFECRTGPNSCNNNLPYSIRTENNFMNYTACNTLFTPGQRERMRASLFLEDRKTLITSTAAIPTYQYPVCAPKINFENGFAEFERISFGSIGCRKYKDYTINLSISSKPTIKVDIQMQVDPTSDALENIDYSFPAGRTVTFPAGSYNTQPLKIRVFYGQTYTVPRTLKLGFKLSDQTTAAVKGTASISMDVRLLPRDNKPIAPGSVVRSQVGEYNENINNIRVFNGMVSNQTTQILYSADELKKTGITAGNITGINFFLLKNTTKSFKVVSIKAGHTKYNELVNNGMVNNVNNTITVASLSSFNSVHGWNNFKFNTPFRWNGIDNIVIEICIENGTGSGFGFDEMYAYSDKGLTESANTTFSYERCGTALSSVSYYPRGIRPIIMFDHIKTGNPVENMLTGSSAEYLGPYAEIYFYDKFSNNRIIGKIKNLTNWDYGCTNISIDRSGNNTAPFWSNINSHFLADKTFTITPERNNPNGKYELTLYYTDAEKAGYENATGLLWHNVQIFKSAVPIHTITPENPQTDKVEIIPVTAFLPYGTAYAMSASFNAHFSSYGVGFVSAAILPVTWGNIRAVVVNEDVMLNWETLVETNNEYFELEKSNDGINFEIIGKVNSKGNGNSIIKYQYLHVKPTDRGKIYYRIKQVDEDGTRSYSNTVYVILHLSNSKPSVYPVPASGTITLNFGKEVFQPTIEIYSIDMKLLEIRRKRGRVLTEYININHLGSGQYIVRVSYEGKTYPLRFVKL